MNKNKKICSKCEREISTSNYNKHFNVCKGKIEKEFIKIKHLIQENGKYKCPHCGKEYAKSGIGTHIFRKHTEEGKNHKPFSNMESWNKGLTKETNESVRKGGETYSKRLKSGERVHAWKGKTLPKEMKENISQSMEIAHEEGRVWNIGMSRWNNEPSYPEQFFMQVIENEFEDKNYEREYPASRYSIDFAWVEKKLAIEIDDQQHEKEEYKERDVRKDKCLKDNGWKVLRIKWGDMFHNTKEQMKTAKQFINQTI